MTAKSKQTSSGRKRHRVLAEAVTLAASGLVVLGIAGYLGVRIFSGASEAAPRAEPALAETRSTADGRFELPVYVVNPGPTGLLDVAVELAPAEGRDRSHPATARIEALGGRSRERIIFLLEEDPRDAPVEVRIRHFRRE